MTTPIELPTEPLLDVEKLGVWCQERPITDPEFAELVLDAVTTLLRQYGSPLWTTETLPKRARDIGYFISRNYYLNPDLLRSETVGPIQENRAEAVLQGIEFTEAQQAELASLVTEGTGVIEGLWTVSTTRGPVEMSRNVRRPNIVLWDTRGGWPIEYLHPDDAGAFGMEDEV